LKNSIVIFFVISSFLFGQADSVHAGFRASRIKSSYPNNQFPSEQYWQNAGDYFSSLYDNSIASGIWIVSLYIDGGITQLNFPNPGGNYPNVWFINQDQNESYLDYFDQHGLKVWLQVEPGGASVDTLIHIVLTKYGHHPCVIGFGVDVEWLDTHLHSGGRKVTDAEAERWETKVKSFNPDYTLFLKHYTQNRMPSNYRGDLIFVDDSQQFTSFTQMVNEFKTWGNSFPNTKVAFQYGYPADKFWWNNLNDPPKTIGQKLLDEVPNCSALFWVDFSINDVFPVTSLGTEDVNHPDTFELMGNYPNPFNPGTTIRFTCDVASEVSLNIYNSLGELIKTLIATAYQGENEINVNLGELSSGIYYYTINNGVRTFSGKLTLLK